MGDILTFRPRCAVVTVEYDVSGWLISRIDRDGRRELLLDAPAISVALQVAQGIAAVDGARIVLGPGAAGWRECSWEAAN